jgi:hypothetical protein
MGMTKQLPDELGRLTLTFRQGPGTFIFLPMAPRFGHSAISSGSSFFPVVEIGRPSCLPACLHSFLD